MESKNAFHLTNVFLIVCACYHVNFQRSSGLNCGLWTLDSGLWTLDSGLWTPESRVQSLESSPAYRLCPSSDQGIILVVCRLAMSGVRIMRFPSCGTISIVSDHKHGCYANNPYVRILLGFQATIPSLNLLMLSLFIIL